MWSRPCFSILRGPPKLIVYSSKFERPHPKQLPIWLPCLVLEHHQFFGVNDSFKAILLLDNFHFSYFMFLFSSLRCFLKHLSVWNNRIFWVASFCWVARVTISHRFCHSVPPKALRQKLEYMDLQVRQKDGSTRNKNLCRAWEIKTVNEPDVELQAVFWRYLRKFVSFLKNLAKLT